MRFDNPNVWHTSPLPEIRKAELDEQYQRVIQDGSIGVLSKLSTSARQKLLDYLVAAGISTDNGKQSAIVQAVKSLYAMDYEHIPVDPVRFFTSKEYFGHAGKALWPAWWRYLIHASKPENHIHEVILTGALGLGKTYVAALLLCYRLYRLSCLRDPAGYYGLAEGSKIVFGMYSLTREHAEEVGYALVRDQLIGLSPFFREIVTPIKSSDDKIVLPGNIEVITGSGELHAIGKNLFSLCIGKGTLVSTDIGLVPIENLVGEPTRVYCFDKSNRTPVLSEPVEAIPTGEAELFEVTLDNGQMVRLTEDHRFLVRTVSGDLVWRTPKTAKLGDDVVSLE